jgi:uncharacterized membrane protein
MFRICSSGAGGQEKAMRKGRLEAFSDGVIAILITIMVLDLKVPHGTTMNDLSQQLPLFLTYVLSFIFLAIYWNNHHHLVHAANRINGRILWANMHLLFWLSLIPFVTGWMGEDYFASLPTATYGAVLLLAAIAYYLLQSLIKTEEGPNSQLSVALGKDLKGKLSPILYIIAIPMAFILQWVSDVIYVSVALMWLVPDKRIESRLNG